MTITSKTTSLICAAFAVLTTAFSILYAGCDVESSVITFASFAGLNLACISGCFGALKPAREDRISEGFKLSAFGRYFAIKSAAFIVAIVAFTLGKFAFEFAGRIDGVITTAAAMLSLPIAFLAGYIGWYDFDETAQHQHASSRG